MVWPKFPILALVLLYQNGGARWSSQVTFQSLIDERAQLLIEGGLFLRSGFQVALGRFCNSAYLRPMVLPTVAP